MKKFFWVFIFFFCIYSVNASDKFSVKFDRCVDGDTAKFFIDGESKTVRFLSINAPEIAHDDVKEEFFGIESSEYVCKLLKRSSKIQLQYDSKSGRVDKYDRVLAWVFVDGDLLQEKLIKGGYAEVKYVYDDYLYSSNLKSLEVVAKDKKLGMWGNSSNSNKNLFSNFSLCDLLYLSIGIIIFLIFRIIKKLF